MLVASSSGDSPWRAVIFDLDGTLIDSAQTILGIINAMRDERAESAIGMSSLRPHLSKGGGALVAASLGDCAADGASDLIEFRSRYVECDQGPEILFPHAIPVARRLAEMGLPLAICTSKPRLLARRALQQSGLAVFFDEMVAGDDISFSKPHPAPLHLTADRLMLDPEECLFVGDSEVDALAAQRAGMDFVLATYGYPIGSCADIEALHRIDCLSELADLIPLYDRNSVPAHHQPFEPALMQRLPASPGLLYS